MSFMDPTAASSTKEREKVAIPSFPAKSPSKAPSLKSGVPVAGATRGNSSSNPDNARTIEAFLNDARNAVSLSGDAGGAFGSPRQGSPRGGSSSGRTSPGGVISPPGGRPSSASKSALKWNAPLPGDGLKNITMNSPGTPAVFGGYSDTFVGGFGGTDVTSPSRAIQKGKGYQFDSSLDPAIRFGIKNLAGNPATATSILPTQASGFGFSGSRFGDIYNRERAASVVQFREMALMRDQLRFNSTNGMGTDENASKSEIERLNLRINELSSEVSEFRTGVRVVKEATVNHYVSDDDRSNYENIDPTSQNVSQTKLSQTPSRGPSSPNNLSRSNSRDNMLNIHKPVGVYPLIRAATRNASRGELLDDSDKEGSADFARVKSDKTGRYLRTTRRDIENARYARGLRGHSGSPAKEFWGEGRGTVQGGGTVGGGIDGADIEGDQGPGGEGGVGGQGEVGAWGGQAGQQGVGKQGGNGVRSGMGDGPFDETEIGDAAAAAFAAALSAIDARRANKPDPAIEIARLKEHNRSLRRELGVAQRLMTGYHAQLMTGGAVPNIPRPSQLEPFGGSRAAPPPSYAQRRPSRTPFGAPPVDRAFSHQKHKPQSFQFQQGPLEPQPVLRSNRRAESKRVSAELGVLRAERAMAERAYEVDEMENVEEEELSAELNDELNDDRRPLVQSTYGRKGQGFRSQIAKDVHELKQLVGDLVWRMDNDGGAANRGEEETQVMTPVSKTQSRLKSPEISFQFNKNGAGESSMSSRSRTRTTAHDDDDESPGRNTSSTPQKSPGSPGISLETNTEFLNAPVTPGVTPSSKFTEKD